MPRISPRLTGFAGAMRNQPTDAEKLLWIRLRGYRPRFTRQHVVGPYILDPACREILLSVECDGSQPVDSEAADIERSKFLEGLGWKVLRFWNSEVQENPDGVADAILLEVGARLSPTHPQPLPVSREGRKRSPRSRPL